MRKLPIIFVTGTAAASIVWADSTTINPNKDNTLIQTTDGSLSNALGDIYAGRTNQTDSISRRRGVIQFDVASAVPSGSTITAVTLRLWLAKAADATVRNGSLYRGSASWGEGTSYVNGGVGASSTTNDATWIHRFYSATSWTSSGGDKASSSSATGSIGSNGAEGQWYTWSSASMVTDVQGWLDTPSTNYGWHLLGDESTNQTARRFTSREATDDTGHHYPELIITYTPPSPFAPGGGGGSPSAAQKSVTAEVDGMRVLGERDLDGDGTPDLLLRAPSGELLGGRRTAKGLVTWSLGLDHTSDDPLAVP